jgi:hypothetical protein
MQGRIIRRSPPAGTGVHSGASLVAVEVKERDRRYLEELRTRRALLDESLASIVIERTELEEMEQVMSSRISNCRERMLERMSAEVRKAQAALAAAEAGRDNVSITLQRAETLVERGYATAMRFDADSAANIEAVAGVSRLRARLERIRIELTAVDAGRRSAARADPRLVAFGHGDSAGSRIRHRTGRLGCRHAHRSGRDPGPRGACYGLL